MKPVFFDLDGPILDISEKFCRLYKDIFDRHGMPTLSCAEYWELKRRKVPIPEIVLKTAPRDFADIYIKERLAVIEDVEYLRHDKVHDGVLPLLAELSGITSLVLVTLRNIRKTLMWELEHFKLVSFFETILTKESNHGDYRVKAELISNYFQQRPVEGIIIGDTEADIHAARHLNLTSLGVTFGIRTEDYIKNLSPDFIVSDVGQMHRAIIEVLQS